MHLLLFFFSLLACRKPVLPSVQPLSGTDSEAVITLPLACLDENCAQPVTTHRFTLTAKLYLDALNRDNCEQSAEQLGLRALRPMFIALCLRSSPDQKRQPTDPAFTTPPDARISAQYTVQFSCQNGRALPLSGQIEEPHIIGGKEGFVYGQQFPSRIVNRIDETGKFNVVMGGHPHWLTNPVLRVYGKRPRKDIWVKSTATIDCRPDQTSGIPSPVLQLRLESTDFPSQKVWFSHNNQTSLIWTKNKDLFSLLWSLPEIPAP